jgi:hypothetical protein
VLGVSFEARLCERSGYPRSQWRVPNEIPWVMAVKRCDWFVDNVVVLEAEKPYCGTNGRVVINDAECRRVRDRQSPRGRRWWLCFA